MSAPTAGWLPWALLSAVFAALTAILAKVGVAHVNADFATLLRTLFAALVLGLVVVATGQWTDPRTVPPRTLLFLALSAVATGASWACYFRALQLAPAYRVAPVDKLSVVLVAIFAFVLLGERPSSREWLGIALVTSGLLVMLWPRGAP